MRGTAAIGLALCFLAEAAWAQRAAATYIFVPSQRMTAGSRAKAEVLAVDAAGAPLANSGAAWTTSDAGVAEFVEGEIVAKNPGTADLAATLFGARGTLRIQVLPQRIEIEPRDAKLTLGDEITFKATAFNAANEPIPGLTFRWEALGSDLGVNNGISIGRNDGRLSVSAAGRYVIRANLDYANSGPGQLLPVVSASTGLTAEAKKHYMTRVLYSTAQRQPNLRLTGRTTSLAMNENGDLAFLASLEGFGTAALRARGKTLEVAAVSGESAGRSGAIFDDIQTVRINNSPDLLMQIRHVGSDLFSSGISLLYASRPSALRAATLAGVIEGMADHIVNMRLGRRAYTSRGTYAFIADFNPSGTRLSRTGVFVGDGSFNDLVFESAEKLDGLTGPFAVRQELGTGDAGALWFLVNDALGRPVLLHRASGSFTVRVAMTFATNVQGYIPARMENLVVSPSGLAALRCWDQSKGWFVATLNGTNLSSAKTWALPSDQRAIYDLNDRGEVLFYGTLAPGTGLYLVNGNGGYRALALEGRAAPNGDIYRSFFSGALNNASQVAWSARTNRHLSVIVRENGGQDELVFPAASGHPPVEGRMIPWNLLSANKADTALVETGAQQVGIAEIGPGGLRTVAAPDLVTPNGQFFGDLSRGAAHLDGSLLIGSDSGVWKLNAQGATIVGGGRTTLPGGAIRFSSYANAANSTGALLSSHSISTGQHQLLLTERGQSKVIATAGPQSAALASTSSPLGGHFTSIQSAQVDDEGNVYASIVSSNGVAGFYAFQNGAWRALLIPGQTRLDGQLLTSFGVWEAGRDRAFALFTAGPQQGIAECGPQECRVKLDRTSYLPGGGFVGGFGTLSVNRRNDLAVVYGNGSNDVVAVFPAGEAGRVAFDRTLALGPNEWINQISRLQMTNSGRVIASVFTSTDGVALIAAEELR
jgi:hypothetical protein